MAAVVRASYVSGAAATPVFATAETGAKYNREESLAGSTTPVPKPNATGTAYSWGKVFALEVTTADTTTISNRRHRISAAPAAGLTLWFRDLAATYAQVTGPLAADNTTTNDAAPTGYTAAPTTNSAYDTAAVTAALGRNGDYLEYGLGVSNLYTGGAGTAIALPDLVLVYDES